MEGLLILPKPSGVVLAAFALAFIIIRIPEKVHIPEHRLYLGKLGVLLLAILLFVPLLFADWKGVEVSVVVRQILGYLAVLFIGYWAGIITVDYEKEP